MRQLHIQSIRTSVHHIANSLATPKVSAVRDTALPLHTGTHVRRSLRTRKQDSGTTSIFNDITIAISLHFFTTAHLIDSNRLSAEINYSICNRDEIINVKHSSLQT
ncbi:unnamed protein product [Cercospora beticola]|nr:unnamed protein product [Cercospora beticola]